MRNLKKFLALVLAMMMVFSLMITANAATSSFSDGEEITEEFRDSVEVLAGMGVLKGDEGKFMPGMTLDRAQAAAIMYRIVTGDAADEKVGLYKYYGDFEDVPSDAWYAGYVGYCANAGIIKGDGMGHFYPGNEVTGYEMLVMLLRAVGYTNLSVFSGSDWRMQVASGAYQLGILQNVNATSYGGTLYKAAPREVVADVTFQAIQLPQYINGTTTSWTANAGNLAVVENESLGTKWFGLTKSTGIVLGNQATGEDYTKIGFTVNAPASLAYAELSDIITDAAYIYNTDSDGDGVTDTNHVTLAFDYTTGLNEFGHKVDVWYDRRVTGDYEIIDDGSNSVAFNTNLTTYYVKDMATRTALVSAGTTNSLDLTDTSTSTALGKLAKDKGFKVDTVKGAFWNYGYGPMEIGYKANTGSGYGSPILETKASDAHPLYLMISNSSDKTLDMVISLNLTVTKITQLNNNTKAYTVGVEAMNDSNQYFGDAADKGTGATQTYISLAQQNLVGSKSVMDDLGSASKTLGKKVIAIQVTGTDWTNDGTSLGNATQAVNFDNSKMSSTYYYHLSELTRVEEYTVINRNNTTQAVTLSDGKTLERSPLALATDAGAVANDVNRVKAPTVYTKYRFYLDADGKYIFWEPITSSLKFVYGTYMDYKTEAGSSAYTYTFVGVDLDGNPVKTEIKKYSTHAAPGTLVDLDKGTNYQLNPIPKADAASATGNVQRGWYTGYLLDEEKGTLTYLKGGVNDGNVPELSIANKKSDVKQASYTDFGSAPIVMNASSANVKVGAVQVGSSNLYLTEQTQFYLVSGAGTATQKVESFKGVSKLMRDYTTVTIDATADASSKNQYLKTANTPSSDADGETQLMVYYTCSAFDYAQNYNQNAQQVDVVILPAAYVSTSKTAGSSLYFMGDNTPGLVNNTGNNAVQFVMYQNGVKHTVWIKGLITDGASASSAGFLIGGTDAKNAFYNLRDTGLKTNDDKPIYDIVAVSNADKTIIGNYYTGSDAGAGSITNTTTLASTSSPALYAAASYSNKVAFIDDVLAGGDSYIVDGAGVKNLNTVKWPGIQDNLETLNNAGSLVDNTGVEVSCMLNTSNSNTVTFIYVNAN